MVHKCFFQKKIFGNRHLCIGTLKGNLIRRWNSWKWTVLKGSFIISESAIHKRLLIGPNNHHETCNEFLVAEPTKKGNCCLIADPERKRIMNWRTWTPETGNQAQPLSVSALISTPRGWSFSPISLASGNDWDVRQDDDDSTGTGLQGEIRVSIRAIDGAQFENQQKISRMIIKT